MTLLQTRPQVKNMTKKHFDFHYTVIKNRDDKEIVNDEYENNENDYNNFNDLITPNLYIGIKNNIEIFRWRNLRSHIYHFK